MKITKLGHSCLLVEMPDRTALFDPGVMSEVDVDSLHYLDDIIVTHEHGDHLNVELVKQLQQKFPEVRIKTPAGIVPKLEGEGVHVVTDAVDGVVIFDAPHEPVKPLYPFPDNIGIHYLDKLTHPGDSLHFNESKVILALPVTAPWGSAVDAVNLAIKLKPKYVIPIHDWHWSDQARAGMYDGIAEALEAEGITFCKTTNGLAFNLDV
jgi:L-ascorbate metabolism protein UlaG (beta-lactamase superfamily)